MHHPDIDNFRSKYSYLTTKTDSKYETFNKTVYKFLGFNRDKLIDPANLKEEVNSNNNDQLIDFFMTQSSDYQCQIMKIITTYNRTELFNTLMLSSGTNYAQDEVFLAIAVLHGNYDMIDFLINNGADITANNNYAIKEACSYKYREDIIELLINNGADIHVNNEFPISIASHNGIDGTVKFLLSNGADPNARDGFPLYCAAQMCEPDLLQYLLDSGANVNLEGALKVAIEFANYEGIKILLQYGASIDKLELEDYVLMVKNHYGDIIQLLSDHGADFSILNQYKIPTGGNYLQDFNKMVNLMQNNNIGMSILCYIISGERTEWPNNDW